MTLVQTDKHDYDLVQDWARLPEGWTFGVVSSVATDSQDRVYVYQRKDPPIVVFDSEGNYVDSWGIGAFNLPHGFCIVDDVIYLTDREDSVCLKYTLDGKPLMVIGERGVHSDTGCEEAGALVPRAAGPFNFPSEMYPSPSGDLYVSDGYRNSRVHRFSGDGRLIASWGQPGKGGPGEFHLPHSLLIDEEGPDLRLRPREQPGAGLHRRGRVPADVDRPDPSQRHFPDHRRQFLHRRVLPGRLHPRHQHPGQGWPHPGPVGLPLRSRPLGGQPGQRLPRPDRRHERGQVREAVEYGGFHCILPREETIMTSQGSFEKASRLQKLSECFPVYPPRDDMRRTLFTCKCTRLSTSLSTSTLKDSAQEWPNLVISEVATRGQYGDCQRSPASPTTDMTNVPKAFAKWMWPGHRPGRRYALQYPRPAQRLCAGGKPRHLAPTMRAASKAAIFYQ